MFLRLAVCRIHGRARREGAGRGKAGTRRGQTSDGILLSPEGIAKTHGTNRDSPHRGEVVEVERRLLARPGRGEAD